MLNLSASVVLSTVMDFPNCGGLCSHMALLQKMLIQNGISCTVADGNVSHKKIKQALLSIIALCKLEEPRVKWIQSRPHFLRKKLERIGANVDLIHAHDPIAAVAALELGYPVVTTIHGPMSRHAREDNKLSESYIAVLKEFERICYQGTSHFVAVDTGQRDILVDEGVAEERITVIPNAVDVDSLRSDLLAQFNRAVSKYYFILPRRLVPKNGPQIAVEAFLAWVQGRDVSLIIAGDGPLRGRIEELCQNHRDGSKIVLLGMIPHCEIPTLVNNSIAALIPSIPYEGVIEATSIAALEALALDVPVIASNIGGLAEIDGGHGVISLVRPGDTNSLCEQFQYWYERRQEVRSTVRSSYIRENFGAEKWSEKQIDVYRKVLNETR